MLCELFSGRVTDQLLSTEHSDHYWQQLHMLRAEQALDHQPNCHRIFKNERCIYNFW
jgi:hypothetical protein